MKKVLILVCVCPLLLFAGALSPSDYLMVMTPSQPAADFSPTNSPNVSYWWDARLYNTNGGIVYLPERVQGLSATNATTAGFPVYDAVGGNGVTPALKFWNGATTYRWLKTADNGFSWTAPVAYMFLMRYDYQWTNTPVEQRLMQSYDASLIFQGLATSNIKRIRGTDISTGFWTNQFNQWMVHTLVQNSSTTWRSYTNLVLEGSMTAALTVNNPLGLSIGGRPGDGEIGFPATIAQIIVVTNAENLSGTITNVSISNVFWWMTNLAQLP